MQTGPAVTGNCTIGGRSFKLIVAERRVAHRKCTLAFSQSVDSAAAAHRKVVDMQLMSLRVVVVPPVDERLNESAYSGSEPACV